MKKIVLCICLGISLFAESSCDKYLEQADKIRLELEKALLEKTPDESYIRSYDKVRMYLDYIQVLQDRYSICMMIGK